MGKKRYKIISNYVSCVWWFPSVDSNAILIRKTVKHLYELTNWLPFDVLMINTMKLTRCVVAPIKRNHMLNIVVFNSSQIFSTCIFKLLWFITSQVIMWLRLCSNNSDKILKIIMKTNSNFICLRLIICNYG